VIDTRAELTSLLRDGAELMSVNLTDRQVKLLLDYIEEFDKWNKAYNLSAVRDISEMVTRHLVDSLSVVPFLRKTHFSTKNIIDVGTGGGLPGVPLAIMFPDTQFTLLDSNGKKTRFLFNVKTRLELDNLEIENCRVEEFKPEKKSDAVISRAFASLQDMTEGCKHLLKEDGIFIAMKGLFPAEELEAVSEKIELVQSIKLKFSKVDRERHLLILQAIQ
jgi:16S rRNA (guanine527-N7)-methyltransferase